jgi:hypothetical protein
VNRLDPDRPRRDDADEDLVDDAGRNATQQGLDEELAEEGDAPLDEPWVTRENDAA